MQKSSLNQHWKLSHHLGSLMESISGGTDRPEEVNLPHDAMLAMKRSPDSPSGANTGYFEGENICYSKEFTVPSAEKDKVHYLYFDGVYTNPSFVINGAFVKKFHHGYVPCCMRIDKYIRYDEPNVLKVSIRGTALPNSRWYSGQGIYRDAWLLTGDRLHISQDGLHVTTLDCSEELAQIEVTADVWNEGPSAREGYAELTVLDGSGKVVAERKARFYADANGKVLVRQRLTLDKPNLWDVDSPNLYSVKCRLTDRGTGETVDCEEAAFGIRKLQLDSKYGLRINGRVLKLKGGCVHHDNAFLGAVSVEDAEVRRVRLHKSMGYNAIRTAHNPPSTALLNACDRLGLLVMDEFTDIWTEGKTAYDYSEYFPECFEEDVERVVRRDYNHPSIILWSIGNEIPDTGNPIGTQWGRKLVEAFKRLDPTRFVTNGLNVMLSASSCIGEIIRQQKETMAADGVNDIIGASNMMDLITGSPLIDPYVEESCDILDVIGYNYANARYEREHPLHPEWIFFGSETFSGALDTNWDTVMRNPYVIGDFCWTSMDYLGEAGCGRIAALDEDAGAFCGAYPWIAAADGDFDLTGFRRPMSYWREIIWGGGDHQPYLAVHRMQNVGKELYVSRWNFTDAVHSWTWPGYEGKQTTVEVYSDAQEVELFINGVSQGRKPVGNDFHRCYTSWDVTYTPGAVEAVAYMDGKEVGRHSLKTAEGCGVYAAADKTTLRAGSSDLSYLEIELRDPEGVMVMTSDKTASVQVTGPIRLAGAGSGDPKTTECYLDNTHRFFEGRLLAILAAEEHPGEATVTVTCEGLEPVTLTYTVV